MTEQKRAAVEYTQEELETMVKAVLNGATIGDVCNVSQAVSYTHLTLPTICSV